MMEEEKKDLQEQRSNPEAEKKEADSGMILGMCLGMSVGIAFDSQKKKKNEQDDGDDQPQA